LELPPEDPILLSEVHQTVEISESVRARLGADLVGIRPRTRRREGKSGESLEQFIDEWGIEHRKTRIDSRTLRMVKHPLEDADRDDIKKFPMPAFDPAQYLHLGAFARELVNNSEYALVADGMWTILQRAYDLRGMENFLVDMITDKRTASSLLERIAEVNVQNIRGFLGEVGELVDVVTVADDLGLQRAPIMSPKLYREIVKPYHHLLVKEIRKYTSAQIMFHSDGSIYSLLDDVVEAGFNIINPLQISAANMEPRKLKKRFGKDLAFWGGVDTQTVLPNGTTARVEGEVRKRIEELADGGGYILGAVHVIQNDVPPENVYALYKAGKRYGSYINAIR